MANVRPIRTEEDYEAALVRLEKIFQAEEGTPEGDEVAVLMDLVEHYEDKHYPMGFPSAIAAIEFQMDQMGMTPRDLIPFIGSRAKSVGGLVAQASHHHGHGPSAASASSDTGGGTTPRVRRHPAGHTGWNRLDQVSVEGHGPGRLDRERPLP